MCVVYIVHVCILAFGFALKNAQNRKHEAAKRKERTLWMSRSDEEKEENAGGKGLLWWTASKEGKRTTLMILHLCQNNTRKCLKDHPIPYSYTFLKCVVFLVLFLFSKWKGRKWSFVFPLWKSTVSITGTTKRNLKIKAFIIITCRLCVLWQG